MEILDWQVDSIMLSIDGSDPLMTQDYANIHKQITGEEPTDTKEMAGQVCSRIWS